MSKNYRSQGLLHLRTVDLARKAYGDTLVEAASALVSIDCILEVQVLDRRQGEAGAGLGSGTTSWGLLCWCVGKFRPTRKLFERVRLNDVLQTDSEALLSGFRHDGHSGDTIAT